MVNVLVVDDEPMLVQSLYQMLTNQTEWTMNVFKALNGSEALEIARENRIDVMLSDICMPNIGGPGTLNLSRRHREHGGSEEGRRVFLLTLPRRV